MTGRRRTRTRAVKVADNVGHAGLVAKEGRQVDRRLGVILVGGERYGVISLGPTSKGTTGLERRTHLGEALRLSAVAGGPLAREEPEGTATGGAGESVCVLAGGCVRSGLGDSPRVLVLPVRHPRG